MNERQLKALIAIGAVTTAVSGCGINTKNNDEPELPNEEIFEPSIEHEVDVYGPMPYFEINIGKKDNNDEEELDEEVLDETDNTSEEETSEDIEDAEEFDADAETVTTKYGAYLLSDEEKDTILKDDFEAPVHDNLISIMYGVMPIGSK